MSAVLVTGSNGFLGSTLIPLLLEKGHTVYALSRHAPKAPTERPGCPRALPYDANQYIILAGDVTKPGLGIDNPPESLNAVYHLAGLLDLGTRKKKEVWETNVGGTRNVLSFCMEHNIPRLYFTSTAYIPQGSSAPRNTYESSKAEVERDILDFKAIHQLKTTIFRPSILIDDPSNPAMNLGAFLQFILLILRVHRKAELTRRKIEELARLPAIRPLFRIQGDGEAALNLIPVSAVARFIAEEQAEGEFWLTDPTGLKLNDLGRWVGEEILLDIQFLPDFQFMPIEQGFHLLAKPFLPYLKKIELPSDLGSTPLVTEECIKKLVHSLLKV